MHDVADLRQGVLRAEKLGLREETKDHLAQVQEVVVAEQIRHA